MNYNNKIKNDYKTFFSDEINSWSKEGCLYAITGTFYNIHTNYKKLWEGKESDIRYFFNNYQREITNARYWHKAKSKQVKVLIFPESATKLHYHGIIMIPKYYYKDIRDQISFDLKELKAMNIYHEMHKKMFKNSCDIRRLESVDGWLDYCTKKMNNNFNDFNISEFLMLP